MARRRRRRDPGRRGSAPRRTPGTSARRARTASGSCSSTPTAARRGRPARRLLRGAGRRRRRRARGRGRAGARGRHARRALRRRPAASSRQEAHLEHPYRPRAVAANLLVRRDGVRAGRRLLRGRPRRRGHRLQLAPAAGGLAARAAPRRAGRAPLPRDARRAATAVARVRGGSRLAGAPLRRVRARARGGAGGRACARRRGIRAPTGRCRWVGPACAGARRAGGRAPDASSEGATSRSTRCCRPTSWPDSCSRTARRPGFENGRRGRVRRRPVPRPGRSARRVRAGARAARASRRPPGPTRPTSSSPARSRSTTARTTGSPPGRSALRRAGRCATRCVRAATCSAAGPASRRCRRSRRRCAGWRGTGARACTRSAPSDHAADRPPDRPAGRPAARRGASRPLMRVHLVDPSAYTLPYDHALCERARRRRRRASSCSPAGLPTATRPRPTATRSTSCSTAMRAGRPARARGRRQARRARARHVALPRHRLSADVVHFQWLPVQAIDRYLLPRRPTVLTAHDLLPREPRPGQARFQRRLYDAVDAVIVHSAYGRRICS